MKKLVVDLDHTICVPAGGSDQSADPQGIYRNALPNLDLIECLRRYKSDGFEIVIHTARNMRTFEGDVSKIAEFTLPLILDWLDLHSVPHDQVIIGKPWCGFDGFYIDDRAVRPSEFVSMSFEEITHLLEREKGA